MDQNSSYGLPWEPSTKARVQRLVEALEIIKGMWTNERFTYTGQLLFSEGCSLHASSCAKAASQDLVGGSGEKIVLKALAKYADGWNAGEIPPDNTNTN